jgi:hypothetical protein
MTRTHIKSIFGRDTSQFRVAQGATTKAYPVIRRGGVDVAIRRNWPYPFGFSLFSRSAALLLVGVVFNYTFLVAPCGAEKISENVA